MLTLVLAESELELVPSHVAGHKQVAASARHAGRRAAQMLLDSSSHHAAMRSLPDGARRGRPDLVHLFLLTALESRANKKGALRVAIHTRNDEWIDVDPATRLIRNYTRFCGMIEKLFADTVVPSAELPLLRLTRDRPLLPSLEGLAADRLLWFDEAAPARNPADVFSSEDVARHVVCVVGGFPHGGFRSTPPPAAERVGFGPEALPTWTMASELTVHYARMLDASGR